MKRYLVSDNIFVAAAVAATAVLTALRIGATVNGYDAELGYYVAGNAAHIAALVLTPLALAAALLFSVIFGANGHSDGGDPLVARISAVVAGTVSLFFAVTQLLTGVSFGHRAGVCLFVAVLFLLPGLFYFLLTYMVAWKWRPMRTVGGLCLVIFAVFYVFHYYFAYDMPFNGDLKILHITAVLSMMLFFLSEAKRTLHRPRGPWARFFASACFLLTVSVGIPELVNFFVDEKSAFEDFSHGLLLAVIGLYALVRLLVERRPVAKAEKSGSFAAQAAGDERTADEAGAESENDGGSEAGTADKEAVADAEKAEGTDGE